MFNKFTGRQEKENKQQKQKKPQNTKNKMADLNTNI
jgi:hypothetical protein